MGRTIPPLADFLTMAAKMKTQLLCLAKLLVKPAWIILLTHALITLQSNMKFITTITRQYEMNHAQMALLARIGKGGVMNKCESKMTAALIKHELAEQNPYGIFLRLTPWGHAVLVQNGERKKMQK